MNKESWAKQTTFSYVLLKKGVQVSEAQELI